MCRPVRCDDCKRPSWVGCGKHVDVVLADVPVADRCRCVRERGGLVNVVRSLFKR